MGEFLAVYLIAFGWVLLSELLGLVTLAPRLEAVLSVRGETLIELFSDGVAVLAMLHRYRKHRWLTAMPLEGQATTRQYSRGLLIGLGLFTLAWLVVWLAGDYRVAVIFAFRQLGLIVLYMFGYMIQSLLEEMVCRGFIMGYWLHQQRVVLAVLANSFFFMALHMVNPGFDSRAAVGIFLFGLLMSLLRLLTGNIWLGAAVHAAWNFAEGIIFGTAVSGLSNVGLILRSSPMGKSTWLDGGTFGIERSLPSMFILLFAIALVALRLRQRRQAQR